MLRPSPNYGTLCLHNGDDDDDDDVPTKLLIIVYIMNLSFLVDKPSVSVVTPDPVVEEQSVIITCHSQGARPAVTSVMWKKGQKVINVTTDSKYSGGTVQAPSLTIGSVLKTDAGEYTCQLGNDVGHGTASVTLKVWCKLLK